VHVGILQVVLQIPDAHSLKDKRRVVRGLLDRVRVRYPVAAAEVDDQDEWRSAVVGFSSVSNEASHAESVLASVLEYVRAAPGALIVEHVLESVGTEDD
jgi:uncharacterized protein YlxP (DUF503 family)